VIRHCPEKLDGIAKAGVKGVEVFCSYHSPDDVAFYYTRTRELGLVPTLGSDFHGYVKPNIQLGMCRYPDGDGMELLAELKAAAGIPPALGVAFHKKVL
jgi:sugar phosphate isomerase/epimerase